MEVCVWHEKWLYQKICTSPTVSLQLPTRLSRLPDNPAKCSCSSACESPFADKGCLRAIFNFHLTLHTWNCILGKIEFTQVKKICFNLAHKKNKNDLPFFYPPLLLLDSGPASKPFLRGLDFKFPLLIIHISYRPKAEQNISSWPTKFKAPKTPEHCPKSEDCRITPQYCEIKPEMVTTVRISRPPLARIIVNPSLVTRNRSRVNLLE